MKKRMSGRKVLRESFKIFMNGVIYRNPVAIGALGLYPVIAAGYNLQNGVALSLMMLIMMAPVCLVSCLVGSAVPSWIRPALILLLSAGAYIPAKMLVEDWMPSAVASIGLYSSLMITNSILLSRGNDYAPNHLVPAVIADSIGCTLGFSLVICLFSAVRELLSEGTLWGNNVPLNGRLDNAFTFPFFGLVLLGFLSALLQHIHRKRSHATGKKANMS